MFREFRQIGLKNTLLIAFAILTLTHICLIHKNTSSSQIICQTDTEEESENNHDYSMPSDSDSEINIDLISTSLIFNTEIPILSIKSNYNKFGYFQNPGINIFLPPPNVFI